MREISQKLEQQEKDRKLQESMLRAIVIGLVVAVLTVVKSYRKK